MKKLLLPIFCLLFAALLLSALPTENEAAIYEDTIRLHILANSDSTTDQTLKLSVRDMILTEYATLFSDVTDIEKAESQIRKMLPEIEARVNEYLLDFGYTASVSLGEEWYGRRYYDDFALPAGEYLSLKVDIGEGEGENWWCVMYPPMCLGMAVEDGTYTESERSLILGEYNVKFKILELISERINKK